MPESEKLIVVSNYFNVSLDYLLKDDDLNQISSEKDNSFQATNKAKWLVGIISCIGGIVCLLVWGMLSLFNPNASAQLSESSMIQIGGNGIFLILCIVAIVVGAVLLLNNTKKK